MKLKELMLSAAFAAGLAIGAAATSALAQQFPYTSVPLSVSGTLAYSTNIDDVMGSPNKKLSFNTQSLIKLLNASPTASDSIFQVTGKTEIPAGSYFLWNPYDGSLTITNKNGFSFPMDNGKSIGGYDYGDLVIAQNELIGTYSLAPKTSAGTETDITGIYFYFNDENINVNEIQVYGAATLHWTYGAAKNGSQKATLTVTMTGNGNGDSFVDTFDAVVTSFSASGTGAASESTDNNVPFFVTW